ncbi:MAG TPA: hypothetical protein VNM48_05330 [Chloroflexota bacterium]|nr:hypothetical protein [Chloroflexota bacterium]
MTQARPRVAAITTVWRKDSHADVLISKLIAGYDLEGEAVQPSVEVVSLYVEQFPENDLSRRWAARFGIPIFGSVREALTLGGDTLAVDGVVIVGEHGEYPWNESGQHLYPRRELFEQVVEVIRGTGRRVPVFNDKHFSYAWESCRWIVDTAADLGLPLMAGSSLPVTYRDPELELPLESDVQEALVLSHGPTESYGFHALETLQCMVERRRGGETGVASVKVLPGDEFWQTWRDERFPRDLLDAALKVSRHQQGTPEGFFQAQATRAASYPGPQPPVAFLVTYRDGLRATVLNLNGYVQDFTFAARLGGQPGADAERVVASAFRLEGAPPRWHFNYLAHHVERFMASHIAPYPVERTLLTSGTLAALMDAGQVGQAGRALETPHLGIRYQPPKEPWVRSGGKSCPPERVWGFTPQEV